MLKSLFGELYPIRPVTPRSSEDTAFTATAVLESTSGSVNERGQMLEQHERDLFISGAAGQAMRAQFATNANPLQRTQRLITFFDPGQLWASTVIQALAQASGQPMERLHLRDSNTLQELAVVERTRLTRRADEPLKVYHADIKQLTPSTADITWALMERSDLCVVLFGTLTPTQLEGILVQLSAATHSTHWFCPDLLFMIPAGAQWMRAKIEALPRPHGLRIEVLSETLTTPAMVWNRALAHWRRVTAQRRVSQGWELSGRDRGDEGFFRISSAMPLDAPEQAGPSSGFSSRLDSPGLVGHMDAAAPRGPEVSAAKVGAAQAGFSPSPIDAGPDRAYAQIVVKDLAQIDGVQIVAVVRIDDGEVWTSSSEGPDVTRAALGACQIMHAHAAAQKMMGGSGPHEGIDEVLTTAGTRYLILRTLPRHRHHLLLAVLDKQRSNLAMTRFRVMQALQNL